jgi:hypothetical protein
MRFILITLPFMFGIFIIVFLLNVMLLSNQTEYFQYEQTKYTAKVENIISMLIKENFLCRKAICDSYNCLYISNWFNELYLNYIVTEIEDCYDLNKLVNMQLIKEGRNIRLPRR